MKSAWYPVALAVLWLAGCGTSDAVVATPPAPDAAAKADAQTADAADATVAIDAAPDVAADAPPDVAPPDVAEVAGPDATDVAAPQDADTAADLAAPAAKAEFSSTKLEFGAMPCGGAGPESRVTTVTNSGDADLFLVLKLEGSPAFSLSGAAARVVAPGASTDITVAAQPLPADNTAGSADAATLTVSTNDSGLAKLDIALLRIAEGATLVLDPPLLAFGPVPLGQVAEVPVKLINTGNVAVQIGLGAPADAQFTLTWPGAPGDLALPPGGSGAPVTVHFKPTQLVPSAATVALSMTGVTCGANATSLTMSGQGLAALPSVSDDLDFGAATCGAIAGLPQTVTVSNAGNQPFSFTAELAQGAASAFALSFASTTVPGGGHVDLTVAPKALPLTSAVPGNYQDVLVVTTNLPDDAPHVIALSQTAAGAIVHADTPSIAFGAVPLGNPASLPLQIRNGGSMPAHVVLTAIGKGFSIEPSEEQTLQPGAALDAVVTFLPDDKAAQIGAIAIAVDPSDALCAAPPAAIALSGIGQDGGLLLDQAQLDFGQVDCGQTPPPQTLVLTNAGAAALQWFADLGRSPSHYSVTPASSGTLAAGEVISLSVHSAAMPAVSSTADNLYGEFLILHTDVPDQAAHAVPIRQGARGAILQFVAPVLDFGSVAPNGKAVGSFAVRNVGNAAAALSLTSVNAAFTNDVKVLNLPPGSTQAANVTFDASVGLAQQSGALTLTTESALCAPLPPAMSLRGQTAAGAVTHTPGSLDFGAVDCGKAGAPQSVVLKNLSNAAVHVTAQLAAATPLYGVTLTPQDGVAAPGGELIVTVAPLAIPKQADTRDDFFGDTLTLLTDAPGDMAHTVALRQAAHGAILAFSLSSLDFGGAALGTAGFAPLAVTNSGNAPAMLSFSAALPATFALPPALWVPARSTVSVPAQFMPQNQQFYSDTAAIATPATVLCKPLALTSLTLAGLGVAKPTLNFTPQELLFGDGGQVACGKSAPAKTVTVTNQTATSTTLSASLAKGAWSAFSVTPATATAEPGVPLTLTLTPKAIPVSSLTTNDYYADSLVLKTGVPGDGKHVVWLHMTAAGAILSFDKPALNLPPTKIGAQTSQAGVFHVHNAGNVAANVSLLLSDPEHFALDQSLAWVDGAQSWALTTTFAPQSTGQKSASVSLTTTAPLCALLPQPLKMTGIGK